MGSEWVLICLTRYPHPFFRIRQDCAITNLFMGRRNARSLFRHRACEWLLPRVRSHVSGDAAFLTRSIPTPVAGPGWTWYWSGWDRLVKGDAEKSDRIWM